LCSSSEIGFTPHDPVQILNKLGHMMLKNTEFSGWVVYLILELTYARNMVRLHAKLIEEVSG
jgi:hypothetical protein